MVKLSHRSMGKETRLVPKLWTVSSKNQTNYGEPIPCLPEGQPIFHVTSLLGRKGF